MLRFLIYNFSAKEAFWNEGEHFSFNNESFERLDLETNAEGAVLFRLSWCEWGFHGLNFNFSISIFLFKYIVSLLT